MNNIVTMFRHTVLAFTAVVILSLVSACVAPTEATNEPDPAETAWIGAHPDEYRDIILRSRVRSDPILTLYRDPTSREDVVAFFDAIVHSRELAEILLTHAEEFDVSPSLAIALVWEESRFNPKAVNKNKSSVDRGLFQLNSRSFPKLSETDFFNPNTNARFGMAHLRWCLELGETEVAGLAMYNAGTTRVRSNGTPKATLDYVARVLSFRNGVDELFERELAIRWTIAEDGQVSPAVVIRENGTRLAAVR